MNTEDRLLELLRELGRDVSRRLHEEVRRRPAEELAAVARESSDDTIYAIDSEIEEWITGFFERRVKPDIHCLLIMEGAPEDGLVFGPGDAADCEYTVIMDPLDGTRGLMYGKRSAWLLAGAAQGTGRSLADISLAVQTEIPPAKQSAADQLYALAGSGAHGVRLRFDSGEETRFRPAPSRATDLHYGFATFNRFIPGAKDFITAIESVFHSRLTARGEQAFYFEDQYICNGGQLAELATGHDRFVCDLRGVFAPVLAARGAPPLLCSHPYDVCTELIAREAGVIVTDTAGGRLDPPMNTTTDVSWIGYANEHLQRSLEPVLLDILRNISDFV